MRVMAMVMAAMLMAGCAGNKAASRAPHGRAMAGGYVEGKARVLEVNNNLGMATLEFKGKRTPAYWNAEVVKPFRVSTVDTKQTTARPTQDLSDDKNAIHPEEEQVVLPAKVGDTVVFRGMWTGGEIFLQGVQVVPN